ncbi:MAG: DUF2357 domain-containing protein [Vicinamibacterales bacterium]
MTQAAGDGVSWHAEGEPADAARRLAAAPATNVGFSEARRYFFSKPDRKCQFRIDDEPLADAASGAAWTWRPGFYAGEVTGELLKDGVIVDRFVLDVSPDARKLGGEAFRQMVQELWAEDPSLVVGEEPATHMAGHLGRFQDPLVAFARLRRHLPEFIKALVAIRANPRRSLRSVRESVSLNTARRVDRYTALSASRSSALGLFSTELLEPTAFNPTTRLDVPVVVETLDSAANRTLKALVLAVSQRVKFVAEQLEQRAAQESASETRTSFSSRWPVRREVLSDAADRLQWVLRQTPFPEVIRAEVSAAGLNVVSADPLYARAWGRGWRGLREGIESDVADERLWISPSWEIYERWCFMRLGRLLEAELPSWRWRRRNGSRRWVGGFAGRKAELWLQPKFRARGASVPGPWSVSRLRIPDITVQVDSGDGTRRFVVLDAKYRTHREAVLDAMASAHIYQDSLRIGAVRPNASLLLVPAGKGAPWLEEPAFQSEHRVGVHVLAPGQTASLPSAVLELFHQ